MKLTENRIKKLMKKIYILEIGCMEGSEILYSSFDENLLKTLSKRIKSEALEIYDKAYKLLNMNKDNNLICEILNVVDYSKYNCDFCKTKFPEYKFGNMVNDDYINYLKKEIADFTITETIILTQIPYDFNTEDIVKLVNDMRLEITKETTVQDLCDQIADKRSCVYDECNRCLVGGKLKLHPSEFDRKIIEIYPKLKKFIRRK
jgi:hypothetical protein